MAVIMITNRLGTRSAAMYGACPDEIPNHRSLLQHENLENPLQGLCNMFCVISNMFCVISSATAVIAAENSV